MAITVDGSSWIELVLASAGVAAAVNALAVILNGWLDSCRRKKWLYEEELIRRRVSACDELRRKYDVLTTALAPVQHGINPLVRETPEYDRAHRASDDVQSHIRAHELVLGPEISGFWRFRMGAYQTLEREINLCGPEDRETFLLDASFHLWRHCENRLAECIERSLKRDASFRLLRNEEWQEQWRNGQDFATKQIEKVRENPEEYSMHAIIDRENKS